MTNITDLQVSLNPDEEKQLLAEGFSKTDVNLNEGAGGNTIYLWFKKDSDKGGAITRIQLSFKDEMAMGLDSAGYQKINKNLNEGTGGDEIYLWYYRGTSQYDVPIVDLHVATDPQDEAQKFTSGWERLACNLNRRAGGTRIYLWVKRETPTYICDITANANFKGDADLFKQGYIRMDENTNRGAGGYYVFIWYRQTTEGTISELQVSSTDDDYKSFKKQGYTSVNQDLNQGTRGHQVLLWFKKEDPTKNPIKAVTVIIRKTAVKSYESAGVQVIPKSLNTGNDGAPEYLCYYQ